MLQSTGSAVVSDSWELPQFLEGVRQSLDIAAGGTHAERKAQLEPLLSSFFSLAVLVSAILDSQPRVAVDDSMHSAIDEYQSS